MKKLLQIIIIFPALFILGCPNSENESIKHLISSQKFKNEAARLSNEGSQPYSKIPPTELEEYVDKLKKALREAKLVNIEFLNRRFSDWGNKYRDEYIKGLELTIKGLEDGDNAKALKGQLLLDKYGSWHSVNLNNFRGNAR